MHVGLEDERLSLHKLGAYFAARAAGGVGLIVTGGIAPNREGWAKPFAAKLSNRWEVRKHRAVTDAVHEAGGRIAMQILHTGRYAYHPLAVAPSALTSPISWFKPRALSARGVRRTIGAFARCARLAKDAGYDGVEIMGSEGYLHQRVHRHHARTVGTDALGRQPTRPTACASRWRSCKSGARSGRRRTSSSSIACRCSTWWRTGHTWDEIVDPGQVAVEEAGATLINTGIGWHEARVPTIGTMVPKGWASPGSPARLEGEVSGAAGDERTASTCPRWPKSRPRSRRRPDGVDGPSRSWPTRTGCDQGRRRAGGRDQHLHRLQPGLPRPRISSAEAGELPGQPVRLPRDRAGRRPATVRQARRRRREPVPPGSRLCDHRGRARPPGHALRGCDRIGGQFNHGAPSIPGKEEFDETLALLPPSSLEQDRGRRAALDRGSRGAGPRELRRRRRRHGGAAA